jgi:hypothetical protein
MEDSEPGPKYKSRLFPLVGSVICAFAVAEVAIAVESREFPYLLAGCLSAVRPMSLLLPVSVSFQSVQEGGDTRKVGNYSGEQSVRAAH